MSTRVDDVLVSLSNAVERTFSIDNMLEKNNAGTVGRISGMKSTHENFYRATRGLRHDLENHPISNT